MLTVGNFERVETFIPKGMIIDKSYEEIKKEAEECQSHRVLEKFINELDWLTYLGNKSAKLFIDVLID